MGDDDEFMTPSDHMATQMHELFTTYLRAGFSETQALKLVVYLMVTTANETKEEE